MTWRALHLTLVVGAVFGSGCSCNAMPTPSRCTGTSDCPARMMCLDSRCVPERDAGAMPDVPSDAGCSCAGGERCDLGGCIAECGDPRSEPCDSGQACDFASGRCVPEGTPGALFGDGTRCGASGPMCMPGTECSLMGQCQPAPPCVSRRCTEDGSRCWGTGCASTRRVASCTPTTVARMNMPDFLTGRGGGVVDLELDDACNSYAVTTVSGPDFLRQLAPDGTLTTTTGVTNLNMGEVAVLRPYDDEFSTEPGEVALTYTCCAECGCIGGDPQGVARLDRPMSALPMVLTADPSSGTGPFGTAGLDSGPYGLTWGRDRTLYIGNVRANGDLHSADLETGTSGEIARLAGRIHATTTFDSTSLLVAIAGGAILRVGVDGMMQVPFAEMGEDVTAMVRDPFLGVVYVAVRSGAVEVLGADGSAEDALVAAGGARGRIAYGPDGALYYLRITTTGSIAPRVERIALPLTRP